MSKMRPTAQPAEGYLVFDKKITVPIVIAVAGIMLGAGVTYATHTNRVAALEAWRVEKVQADAVLGLKVDAIKESTIRMEEQLKAIASAIGAPRRP